MGTKDRLKSGQHNLLLLALFFHGNLVQLSSQALSPLVLCNPQNIVKPPFSTLLTPLVTTISLAEVRGHAEPLDVGFPSGTSALSWVLASGQDSMESRSQQFLQRAPPDGNAFGSPHWAVHSWTSLMLSNTDCFPFFVGENRGKGQHPM